MSLPLTRKDLMIVNMGPQHPSMHGVLRLIVTLDGEDVIDCEPILGYLHRGMEKIAENRTIILKACCKFLNLRKKKELKKEKRT
uniref:NAD(P)H dehydrogenase subunit H n=1 Tax=Psathyrostachys huashanica TaxID=37730 RepID=A0A6C0RUY6_9POAL|nr:NADH-plastoquinone oxidoreductase subunit 7 [Psathyrostachys huashanica]QIA44604.1 NADH-plastoquinone oxidoreductase subunit 7 [Psathyrostachys huashanica]